MTAPEANLHRVAGGYFDSAGFASSSPLFRPEALEAAAGNGLGGPIAFLPVSWRILSLTILTMVVAFAVFLVLGTYDRKESAAGIVRSVGGDTPISASTPGVISRIAVREGQHVRVGDPLLTVSTARTAVDGRSSSLTTIKNLDDEVASLKDRLAALDTSSRTGLNGDVAQASALRSQLSSASAEEQQGRQRLMLAEEALRRVEPIADKGFISGEAMRQRREEIILMKQAIAQFQGEEARLQAQIDDLRVASRQRPLSLIQQRGQLIDQIAKDRRDRNTLVQQDAFSVRAPSSGIVSALQVVPGELIDPQRKLMEITTANAQVSAELFVPSRAIGFLEVGQNVRVRYDAFPYQRFGAATARIDAISTTVLRPQDVDAAMKVEEPVYRVLISLDRQVIRAYGRKYRIRPGFALTADVILERRNFLDWLLDPIRAPKGGL